MLLEELLFLNELMKSAKESIDTEGITIEDAAGISKANPSVTIYSNSLKSALSISRKLGLSHRDAQELGMVGSTEDGFDDD
jgi:P27 family predicted phage terminase small subunit